MCICRVCACAQCVHDVCACAECVYVCRVRASAGCVSTGCVYVFAQCVRVQGVVVRGMCVCKEVTRAAQGSAVVLGRGQGRQLRRALGALRPSSPVSRPAWGRWQPRPRTLPPTREGAVTVARAGPGSAPHTSRPQPQGLVRGLVRALTTPERLALRDASQRARP